MQDEPSNRDYGVGDQHVDEEHDFFWGANPLKATVATFRRWLHLPDVTPVHAVLGTVAANNLDGGDPVWLIVIAPPSSAKTEILNALSRLAYCHAVGTITPGGLLSGSAKKDRAADAKGGLLRQIGRYGILINKDFGSLISMRAEQRAETFAALREVYDGAWTRHVGQDGGRTLHWDGKLGLIGGATEAYDSHYAAVAAMGDRMILCRFPEIDDEPLLAKALDHTGELTQRMREELAATVAQLFISCAGREPRSMTAGEAERLNDICRLAVRLRQTVERDRLGQKEIENVLRPEGTPRLGLALERLLAGLDIIGMEREDAFAVVESIAKDSCPRLRRKIYEYLADDQTFPTRAFADLMGLPTGTTRRILEDLAATGLATRSKETTTDENGNEAEKAGGPDLWSRNNSWRKFKPHTNGST